jgi:hypothetical protein
VKTVCFDFDGVLASYDGWKDGAIGDPIPGGVALLRMCDAVGYRIVIQTCRTHPEHGAGDFQLRSIKSWLRDYKIPCDYIELDGKAMAHVYVDDRGLYFDQQLMKDLSPEGARVYAGSMFDIIRGRMERVK